MTHSAVPTQSTLPNGSKKSKTKFPAGNHPCFMCNPGNRRGFFLYFCKKNLKKLIDKIKIIVYIITMEGRKAPEENKTYKEKENDN